MDNQDNQNNNNLNSTNITEIDGTEAESRVANTNINESTTNTNDTMGPESSTTNNTNINNEITTGNITGETTTNDNAGNNNSSSPILQNPTTTTTPSQTSKTGKKRSNAERSPGKKSTTNKRQPRRQSERLLQNSAQSSSSSSSSSPLFTGNALPSSSISLSSVSSSSKTGHREYRCGTTCPRGTRVYTTTAFQSIVEHMRNVHKLTNREIVEQLREVPSHSSFKQDLRCCNFENCDAPVFGKAGFTSHYNLQHKPHTDFTLLVQDIHMPDDDIHIYPTSNAFADNNDDTQPLPLSSMPEIQRVTRSRSQRNTSLTNNNVTPPNNNLNDSDSESDDDDYIPSTESVASDDMEIINETPTTTPSFDYFEETLEDGSTILHEIKVAYIKNYSHETIRNILAMSEEELLEYLTGVSHPRVNKVNNGHVDIFRDLNNRLLRATIEPMTESGETDSSTAPNPDNRNPNTTIIDMDLESEEKSEEEIFDTEDEADEAPLTPDESSQIASIAQFLLPTIYWMIKKSKRSMGKTTQKSYHQALFNCSTKDLIGCICYLFKLGRIKLEREDAPQRTPSKETIAKKVNQMVIEDGHVSRGMNYLCRYAGMDGIEAPPHLNGEEFKEKVQSLHPLAHPIHDDITTEVEELPLNVSDSMNGLELSGSVLNTTLRKLKRDSTPGWDGWTFQLIRQLYEERDVDDEAVSDNGRLLIQFIKHGIAGNLPLNKLWNVSKMVLMPAWNPANNSWKFRPIAIGTSWYRLIGKSALNIMGDSVGRKLDPLQFAVGIPDGISIAAMILQHHRENDDNAILSIDLSNAFNSIRRTRILEGLRQYAPQLLPFFKWSYNGRTELRTSTGTRCGFAETGTRQGDPLSMLYFAVGIHPLIEKLSGKIKSLNPEHNFLQSYADDISLCIKRENLAEAWTQIADVFPIDGGESGVTANPDTPYEAIGLAVNPLKCFALVAKQPSSASEQAFFHGESDIPSALLLPEANGHSLSLLQSHKIFGVMIGNVEDRINFSTNLYKEIEKKGQYITSYCGPKAGFSLVKYCLNGIATYLHRIEDESTLDLEHHDGIVSKTLAALLNKNTLTKDQDIIRGLPHKLGGLGILRHAGPVTRINHDDLQSRTHSWLEHCGLASPPSSSSSSSSPSNPASSSTSTPIIAETVHTNDDLSSTPSQHPHLGLHNVLYTFPKLTADGAFIQRELGFETENRDGTPSQQRKQQIHKRTFKNLMSKYKNNSSTLGDALWLDASSFNGSGDLLLCGSYHLRQFNDDEFRSVLETKLLMNPTYQEQLGKHVNTRCESCDRDQFQHPMIAKKFHYLNCRKQTRERYRRHNVIVANLFTFLNKVFPSDDIQLSLEEHLADPNSNDNRRGDVTITWQDNQQTHFDVGITSPVLNMLVSRHELQGNNDPVQSLTAASNMHEEKIRKYKDIAQIYPIIFLATGRPSKQMSNICRELLTKSELSEAVFMSHWRTFLRSCMRTCLKFIARSHRDRPHLHVVQSRPHYTQQKSKREQKTRLNRLKNKYHQPLPTVTESKNEEKDQSSQSSNLGDLNDTDSNDYSNNNNDNATTNTTSATDNTNNGTTVVDSPINNTDNSTSTSTNNTNNGTNSAPLEHNVESEQAPPPPCSSEK